MMTNNLTHNLNNLDDVCMPIPIKNNLNRLREPEMSYFFDTGSFKTINDNDFGKSTRYEFDNMPLYKRANNQSHHANYNKTINSLHSHNLNNNRTSSSSRLSIASNAFTVIFFNNLLKHLREKKGVIISPYSVFNLFIILYLGSYGSTEAELKKYFNLPDKKSSLADLNYINDMLIKNGTMKKMNLVCISKKIKINNAFVNNTKHIATFSHFDPNNVDYEVKKLNNIIENATNGTIKDIMNSGMMKDDTAMILVNTLYFYSKWKNTFDEGMTAKGIFYGEKQKQVQYMNLYDDKNRYYEDNKNQILEKDYEDSDFCMGFILPKNKHEKPTITHEQFNYYVTQLKKNDIDVLTIPKFKHQSKFKFDNLLKKYGLREVFTKPNFSGIMPKEVTPIDDIIHVAVIDVNESGTEASAATIFTSYNCIKDKTINFIANHPFIYYIRHIPTNTILFIGQFY